MIQKILIINKTQFGYHTDSYKYCEHLREEFDVTYLCFDSGLNKLEMENINVKYIPNKGTKIFRGIRFIIMALLYIASFKGIIFIHYFEKCQILKQFFPKKKMILDIRTLSTDRNNEKRGKIDYMIKNTTKYFDHTTIISHGLQKKLNLDSAKSTILPLGSDIISNKNKIFTNLSLLYVGNLSTNREIEKTIVGLSIFCQNNPDQKIVYNIVGGEFNQIEKLKNVVDSYSLNGTVIFHGRVLHSQLKPFFDECNIGVSFIPITDWYHDQPPTKTYEYIISGLFTLATATNSNIEIINSNNGLLISDSPESFAKGLEKIVSRKHEFKSDTIRNTLINHTWSNIIDTIYKPLIKSL
jgi:glycosyltransferase involved in cell wall biosynthesis